MKVFPTIEEQERFYNDYWRELKPFGASKLSRIIKILEYFQIIRRSIPTPKIIDFGCGDGRCVAFWNELGSATGIDLSSEAVNMASKRYPFITFRSGDAINSGYHNESFDVIVSQEVIEHIENQVAYLNECHRLLRKDGFLILTTPNKYVFDRKIGGNYSNQPIEKILLPTELKNMIQDKFMILKFESTTIAKGDYGIYRIISNPYFVSILSKLRLDKVRRKIMSRYLFGLHLCVLAKKK